MKIGIIYIGTGRYICFWKGFFETAQKFLFPEHEKTFFVITDSDKIDYGEKNNVKKYFYPKMGWPEAGLYKYDAVLQAENDLKKCDYLFYFNGNMEFVGVIRDEILPDEKNGNLAICEWASYTECKNAHEFPYDRNPKCSAYIAPGQGKHYFMGGLWGGRSKEVIEMCKELNEMTKNDVANGIIASHHDESYINKYMIDKNPLVIPCEYCMPDKWKIKGHLNIKGKLLKKHHYKWGGHAYLRGETDKKITPLKWWLNKVFGTHFI